MSSSTYRKVLIGSILTFFLTACQRSGDAKQHLIFDGLTFTGWEGSKEFFRIEDGAIVAGSLKKSIPTNQFLCTESDFGDFELTVNVKFSSQENNAGIQIRSQRIPNHHEVIGYQSDIGYAGSKSVWGSLYDESRRNKFLAEADIALIHQTVDIDNWNHYRIRCEGARIRHWINEVQVLDYTEKDESIATEGKICVQIHSGAPAEAWYKDLQLIELR